MNVYTYASMLLNYGEHSKILGNLIHIHKYIEWHH
jgi:hypothetical protein